MIWKRKPSPVPGDRPSDDKIMEMLRDALGQVVPSLVERSRIRNGVLGGLGGWGLMALPNHTDSSQHFDIGFVVPFGSAASAVLPDCISGIGSPEDAAAMMVRIWRETSGACLAEMLTRRGEHASHLEATDAAGLPGWHSVVSGVLAYGADPGSNDALQSAMLDNEVLRAIAPALVPALDRPAHNAVKIFYQRAPNSATAEIRVNGAPVPVASEALAALPWPEVIAPTIARFYAVAVHPA